jgi:hypothetical protein
MVILNGMIITSYSEHGDSWNIFCLLKILKTTHKYSGCNLHNWMFV